MSQDDQLNDIEIVGGDPSTYLPDGEPYPPLELPTEAELRDVEQATADQVVTVRDEQALAIANLGNDQLPHFLSNVDGVERCGSDGDPWPCASWMNQINPQAVEASSGVPQTAKPYTAAEVAMAEEMGIPVAELRGRLGAR